MKSNNEQAKFDAARIFKAIRKAMNFTQQELASKTGISLDRVKNIEAGRIKNINNFEIRALAESGVNVDWILFDKGDVIKNIIGRKNDLILNIDLLKNIITELERSFSKYNLSMEPQAKAISIVKLYEYCIIAGEDEIKEDNIKRLLNIV